MADYKDYYRILGLEPGAGDEEVRRAYRDLALKHHPDRQGGDTCRFQEVQEAYEVLSDPRRRDRYLRDRQAREEPSVRPWNARREEEFPGRGGYPSDLFGDLLADLLGRRQGWERRPTVEITLTQEEARHGASVPLEVPLVGACRMCGGTGEQGPWLCRSCAGSGLRESRRSLRLDVPAGLGRGRYHMDLRDSALPGGALHVVVVVE